MSARYLLIRSLGIKNGGSLSRAYHDGGYHKKTTMNDLPVPQGDWQEAYNRKNTRYNMVLAAGVFIFAATCGLVRSTGIIHFNYSPPESID